MTASSSGSAGLAATAEQHLAAGDLAAALAALQHQVRRQPGDARLRIFLFQLLALQRQWERAANQLKVCGDLDAGALAMVGTYREAIQAELVRAAVMAGRTTPVVFGEPPAWVGGLVQALVADARGEPAVAVALRGAALEAAPTTAGTLDGEPFDWIADADSRLGPVLEVVLRGRYGWLPFAALARVTIEAPTDLRDLIWLPAQLTFANGGESVALIPARYGAADGDEPAGPGGDALRLGRRTDWLALDGLAGAEPTQFRGLGQRVLTSSGPEKGLLDVREIVLAPPA